MRLLSKKPAKLVAVAVADEIARIAWAITAKGDTIGNPPAKLAAFSGLCFDNPVWLSSARGGVARGERV
jgi:hypothetical protein